MTSLCVIAGDVNSDVLVEVVSARFLHYGITAFLSVNSKYLVGCYLIFTY